MIFSRNTPTVYTNNTSKPTAVQDVDTSYKLLVLSQCHGSPTSHVHSYRATKLISCNCNLFGVHRSKLGYNPVDIDTVMDISANIDIDTVMDISANIIYIEQINLNYKYSTVMEYLKTYCQFTLHCITST
jgi:hypothetical protein